MLVRFSVCLHDENAFDDGGNVDDGVLHALLVIMMMLIMKEVLRGARLNLLVMMLMMMMVVAVPTRPSDDDEVDNDNDGAFTRLGDHDDADDEEGRPSLHAGDDL